MNVRDRTLRQHLGDLHFHVILVLREKSDWWRSYRNQIEKDGEFGTPDVNSRACLDRSGWLTDFATLETVYRRNFDEMTVLDYGPDIVPKLLRVIGVPESGDYAGYNLNTRLVGRAYWMRRAKSFYARHLSDTVLGRIKRAVTG